MELLVLRSNDVGASIMLRTIFWQKRQEVVICHECWHTSLYPRPLHFTKAHLSSGPEFSYTRSMHLAPLEPKSLKLWEMGGYNRHIKDSNMSLLKLSFQKPITLKDLAINCIVRCMKDVDVRLLPDQLPSDLNI